MNSAFIGYCFKSINFVDINGQSDWFNTGFRNYILNFKELNRQLTVCILNLNNVKDLLLCMTQLLHFFIPSTRVTIKPISSLIGHTTASSSYYSTPTVVFRPTVILARLSIDSISLSFSFLFCLAITLPTSFSHLFVFGPINLVQLLARSISTAAYTTFWRRVLVIRSTRRHHSSTTRATLLYNG